MANATVFSGSLNQILRVIVAKPKSRGLYKAYDNAILLLKKPTTVNHIEQAELKKY